MPAEDKLHIGPFLFWTLLFLLPHLPSICVERARVVTANACQGGCSLISSCLRFCFLLKRRAAPASRISESHFTFAPHNVERCRALFIPSSPPPLSPLHLLCDKVSPLRQQWSNVFDS